MDAICTISDMNYAPSAFAMLTSAYEKMPTLEFFFLDISDCKPRMLDSAIQVLSLEDIGLSSSDVRELSRKYNIVEFATAVKPVLLSALLSRGFRTVTYLDPDILITNSMLEVFDVAQNYEAVIVPHRLTPDKRTNSRFESLLNRVGIYNLGYITVSDKSISLLNWWKQKTFNSGSMNWYMGQFTDQKWVDFFPAYFQTLVFKHPGYNLAIWNVDERPLIKKTTNEIYAGRDLLCFVHFSQSSHRLEDPNIQMLWKEASSCDLPIILSLVAQYTDNIADAKSRMYFESARNIQIRLKLPGRRINARDSLIAGIREDWFLLRKKFPKRKNSDN